MDDRSPDMAHVGEITVDALSGTIRGGMALTSHDTSASATAVFDDPSVK